MLTATHSLSFVHLTARQRRLQPAGKSRPKLRLMPAEDGGEVFSLLDILALVRMVKTIVTLSFLIKKDPVDAQTEADRELQK